MQKAEYRPGTQPFAVSDLALRAYTKIDFLLIRRSYTLRFPYYLTSTPDDFRIGS